MKRRSWRQRRRQRELLARVIWLLFAVLLMQE
jgi:hypothetical protein